MEAFWPWPLLADEFAADCTAFFIHPNNHAYVQVPGSASNQRAKTGQLSGHNPAHLRNAAEQQA